MGVLHVVADGAGNDHGMHQRRDTAPAAEKHLRVRHGGSLLTCERRKLWAGEEKRRRKAREHKPKTKRDVSTIQLCHHAMYKPMRHRHMQTSTEQA